MAALLVAGFVGLFSETALNVALGQLSEVFNVGPTTIQWLATGYFLTLGILIPVTGILMQKFTTRQMFLTSIILSLVGTILAASAPAFGVLLTGRIIQAAGLAISLPLTQNVIFTIFPPNKRGGAMGLMGLVMLAGPALGPTLAGLILDTLSWHWIFWLTIPFLLFSLIFGIKFLPNVNEVRNVSIDALSVILSTIGFGGVVYGFSVSGEFGWGSSISSWSHYHWISSTYYFCDSSNENGDSYDESKSIQISTFHSWGHYEFHHVLQYVIYACYFTNVYANGFINGCIYNRSCPSAR